MSVTYNGLFFVVAQWSSSEHHMSVTYNGPFFLPFYATEVCRITTVDRILSCPMTEVEHLCKIARRGCRAFDPGATSLKNNTKANRTEAGANQWQ